MLELSQLTLLPGWTQRDTNNLRRMGKETSLDNKLSSGIRSLTREYLWLLICETGLPDSSVGKESTCNAGDPGLIPGLGRSTGEEVGYPLQYSWASLVA